jgi:hypothetical protein
MPIGEVITMCNNCIHQPVCSIYRATGGKKNCEHHREERRGEWVNSRYSPNYGEYEEQCSYCNEWSAAYGKPFCPNCGADMRGEKDG